MEQVSQQGDNMKRLFFLSCNFFLIAGMENGVSNVSKVLAAIEKDDFEEAAGHLNSGTPIVSDHKNRTYLHFAALRKFSAEQLSFLESMVTFIPVNQLDSYGCSALYYLVMKSNWQGFELLLRMGADKDAGNTGYSAAEGLDSLISTYKASQSTIPTELQQMLNILRGE
jgi:hypothetical protein